MWKLNLGATPPRNKNEYMIMKFLRNSSVLVLKKWPLQYQNGILVRNLPRDMTIDKMQIEDSIRYVPPIHGLIKKWGKKNRPDPLRGVKIENLKAKFWYNVATGFPLRIPFHLFSLSAISFRTCVYPSIIPCGSSKINVRCLSMTFIFQQVSPVLSS